MFILFYRCILYSTFYSSNSSFNSFLLCKKIHSPLLKYLTMAHKGSLLLNGLAKADSLTAQTVRCPITEKFSFHFSLLKSSTNFLSQFMSCYFWQHFLMPLQCRCICLTQVHQIWIKKFAFSVKRIILLLVPQTIFPIKSYYIRIFETSFNLRTLNIIY